MAQQRRQSFHFFRKAEDVKKCATPRTGLQKHSKRTQQSGNYCRKRRPQDGPTQCCAWVWQVWKALHQQSSSPSKVLNRTSVKRYLLSGTVSAAFEITKRSYSLIPFWSVKGSRLPGKGKYNCVRVCMGHCVEGSGGGSDRQAYNPVASQSSSRIHGRF